MVDAASERVIETWSVNCDQALSTITRAQVIRIVVWLSAHRQSIFPVSADSLQMADSQAVQWQQSSTD